MQSLIQPYAAIDIGSNAVRLLIATVNEQADVLNIKKLSLTRVPIRLGEDVFEEGSISQSKEKDLVNSIKAFKLLIDVYKIKSYRATATSAMREASNGDEVISRILDESGVQIELISGDEEANLIFSLFYSISDSSQGTYLFIDVGGGSTEVSVLKDGKRIKAKSFRIGTVRLLKGKVEKSEWQSLKKWLKELKESGMKNVQSVGTGGNINRIFKISRKKYMDPLTYAELKDIQKELNSFTFEERMAYYNMKSDRADVIVHAMEIYLFIMKNIGSKEIVVPKMGLSDAVVYGLSGSCKFRP